MYKKTDPFEGTGFILVSNYLFLDLDFVFVFVFRTFFGAAFFFFTGIFV